MLSGCLVLQRLVRVYCGLGSLRLDLHLLAGFEVGNDLNKSVVHWPEN